MTGPTRLWLARCRDLALIGFALITTLLALPAHAHKASDAYLQLRTGVDQVELRWDIALRDLDAVLDLDANNDRRLSWGEVKQRLPDIRAYALSHLVLAQGRCSLTETDPPALEKRVDGNYLVLQLSAHCTTGAALDLDYRLFREVDPTHRGLLRIDLGADTLPTVRSLDPTGGPVAITLTTPAVAAMATTAAATTPATSSGAVTPSTANVAGVAGVAKVAEVAPVVLPSIFLDGIHHILIGYDHILFLICLLLPAVLTRRAGGWQPVARWQDAMLPMLAIVTMFTLGHSITLALAGLQWVTLSPRVIEPAIALTIIVAAIDNMVPLLRGKRRIFTFLFGLVHGFGFAGVLAEMDLPVSRFLVALLEFNLGVEAGQLVIVTVALSVLLALRRWRSYSNFVLRGGSAFAIVIALLWFIERVADVKLLPV